MVASRPFFLAILSAIAVQQVLAQTTYTVGADGCSGLSNDGHCCPGSIIGAGSESAICCSGDPNLDLINASGGVSVNIEGSISSDGANIGNIRSGPSTCTAGTSTAFASLPSTASQAASQSSNGATTTTSVDSSGQTCVTVIDGGSISQQCNGAGDGDSGTMITSSSSTMPTDSSPSGNAQSGDTSTSGNAGFRAVATAAPVLAGAFMGLAAVL